ncbi:response regulator [Roseateles saccharophilus]|uniref:histidine kinase n=1 Tax=Roseateles saccharophilus TaxID=304 RepID=A0A4R3VER9_ROSSA|nr:response regulator [Roseateles saccharophilus]MDG0832163.1 hybrid sensor histidine kinase/response regulator [Roseateles saccharophilus]TCV02463.1 phospho-acceptor domain-containing protein [Roseateles saccharophilus]
MTSRPIKLLAVEDSENDVRLAMLMLRRAGFAPDFHRVQDRAALEAALVEGPWDAVISDFSMPGFGGLDALATFRATGLDIPFIFVSGTIGEETAVVAMKAGANDYVMKDNMSRLAPVLERELVQAARRAAHREAEMELRRYEAQLGQAQKMESLGTLAGGIAHDFNNILGAILGNVKLARGELVAGHPALAMLGEIQKASLRARDLVRQILTFSRRQPQQLGNIALRPIVDETYRLLRATLPAGVDLVLDLCEAPLYVDGDATQLQQVLMNLCTNAWHALRGETGRIVIGLETVHLDAMAARALSGLVAGPYAHLWVSDTGTGMDAATRERIFEPFFTTKPTGQGTGLGLSVVHGIIVAHHGSVAVDSAPGQGSTFHLYLPAVAATLRAPAVEPTAEAPAPGNGEHVIYLDDDETVMLVVMRLLERAGYRCSGFLDSAAALATVREAPDAVNLFVSDFNMPGRSGLDVAREIASIQPDLPVVISSGLITDELREQARSLGVRAILEKEDIFRELVALVGRVLATGA